MEDFFTKLQDEKYFCDFVSKYFEQVPEKMADILDCKPETDSELIKFAHSEYLRNIDRFAVLLASADPDHYKRAASLLHALYESKVIKNVQFAADLDDLETGFGPVHIHHADVNGDELDFARFYKEYHNEMAAFMFAFQCCAAYEKDQKEYDFPFLRTMCVYMGGNTSLNVETFFMLFKALMYR